MSRSLIIRFVAVAMFVVTSALQSHGALVSHWTFDNPGALGDDRGAFNNDTSGNIGAPAFTPAAAVGAGALDLNGSSAPIVPNAFRYGQLDDNADGFTVSAFVNRDNATGVQRILSTAMGGGFTPVGWGVGFNGNNALATTYGRVDYGSGVAVPTGDYHHVAYTYSFNGTNQIDSVKFFLDGVEMQNLDIGGDGMNNVPGGSYTIGNLNLPGNPQFFSGDVDDLRVYNQELSSSRIADLAAGAPSGNIVTPTLASSSNLNSFNVGTPDKLTDNSGLSFAVNTGDTLDQAEVATHLFNGGFQQSWVTNASTGDYFATGVGATETPTFVWDLGESVIIEDIVLWQYQNNGGNGSNIGNDARTFELRFSGNGTFAGGPEFEGTLASILEMGGLNLAQSFNLEDILGADGARFVELRITDNYAGQPGITGGGDRVGLGEIRFNVSQPVPEPTTATLGLIGLAGLLVRRRRAA